MIRPMRFYYVQPNRLGQWLPLGLCDLFTSKRKALAAMRCELGYRCYRIVRVVAVEHGVIVEVVKEVTR